jgi:hypothetical protein
VEDGGVVSAALSIERTPWAEWGVALIVSVLVNGLVFFAFAAMLALELVRQPPVADEPVEAVVVIVPRKSQPARPAAEKRAPAKRPFARTDPGQPVADGERARFIGERATAASSEAVPVVGAPNLPSQTGEDDRFEKELETTSSDWQDGDLGHARPASPASVANPSPPVDPALRAENGRSEVDAEAKTTEPEAAELANPAEPDRMEPPDAESAAPPKERLAQGPLPVDRPLPPEPREKQDELKETARSAADAGKSALPPEPKPQADPREPGFRGYQRKTRLRGSISRRGPGSLDVDETALGRYQAALSRAVEREWQRNCVRYRDFITPGFLTVRFLVDPDGGVRSVKFLETVDSSEIQKGFTLNSIRKAAIPKMPDKLKKQLEGEPLELIYNFYF